MTNTSLILLASALAGWPASRACAQAHGSRMSTNLERTVDASIKPGDDFFGYANGAWLKATEIPAGKERWGARNEIDDIVRPRVMQVLDDANRAPRGSLERKVADFRSALANEATIDAKGVAPLKPLLDSIDRLKDKAALTRALGRGMRADVDPLNNGVYRSASLLGLSVEQSIHGERTLVAFLVQGGLGLPDRSDYVGAEPAAAALRATYRAYVARVLTLGGFPNGDRRADAVLALETAIARTQATREVSANDHNADTVWTRAEFARNAPGMDWTTFFAAAGLAREDALGVWQPTAVRGVAALVQSEPLEAWKDYLRVRALDTYADALPSTYARDTTPRAQRALDVTEAAMSEAIGRMYVERYFPAEQKARIQRIVANVTDAFIHRLEAVSWMSPGTKAIALEKLKTLYVGVGYPEHWADFSDLVVDPTDAMGNLRRVADRNYRHTVAQLGKPVDKTQWWIAPQAVGGILAFQMNAYNITAALLQPPKFDPAASDAACYGAIGAIIGHDVAHFVDALGAEYAVDGTMRRWWTPDDVQRFQATTEPLAKQFSGYRPFPDVGINGTLTLSENVADLGGLAAAFDAHRRALGNKAADKAMVRDSDREFFIAFAQTWRGKLTDAGMRKQAATNDHAPEMYRIATVRNMDAWYDAFDVQPGQRLYLEPAARVRIW